MNFCHIPLKMKTRRICLIAVDVVREANMDEIVQFLGRKETELSDIFLSTAY